jgi:transposase
MLVNWGIEGWHAVRGQLLRTSGMHPKSCINMTISKATLTANSLPRMTMGKQKDDTPVAQRRALAAKLLLNGEGISEVSRKARLSLPTVSIIADGAEAVEQIKGSGRKATLGPEALKWLRGILEGSPTAHGYETELWRNGDVQKLIKEKFGIYHSAGHVRTIAGKLGLDHRMRPPKLRTEKKRLTINDETLAWVAATLKGSPRVHGIDADHWTNGRLRTVLHRQVGVDYSRGYIWEIATRAGVADLLTRRRN